jgi:hypothetical protein
MPPIDATPRVGRRPPQKGRIRRHGDVNRATMLAWSGDRHPQDRPTPSPFPSSHKVSLPLKDGRFYGGGPGPFGGLVPHPYTGALGHSGRRGRRGREAWRIPRVSLIGPPSWTSLLTSVSSPRGVKGRNGVPVRGEMNGRTSDHMAESMAGQVRQAALDFAVLLRGGGMQSAGDGSGASATDARCATVAGRRDRGRRHRGCCATGRGMRVTNEMERLAIVRNCTIQRPAVRHSAWPDVSPGSGGLKHSGIQSSRLWREGGLMSRLGPGVPAWQESLQAFSTNGIAGFLRVETCPLTVKKLITR